MGELENRNRAKEQGKLLVSSHGILDISIQDYVRTSVFA